MGRGSRARRLAMARDRAVLQASRPEDWDTAPVSPGARAAEAPLNPSTWPTRHRGPEPMIDTFDTAATERRTLILVPPPDAARALELAKPTQVGALALHQLEARHLVKGHRPLEGHRLAVIWTAGARAVRLVALGPAWRLHQAQGQPIAVPPLDLTRPETGPRARLEAVAVAADLGLELTIRRADGPRRVRRVVLNLDAQLLVAEDLDRQGIRSFRLADLEAVELPAGQAAPTWADGRYQLGGGPRG